MDAGATAPRALDEDETELLRDLLKAQLSISNDDDAEDAENLLDYAVDMIDSGENIGHVAEELKFMEMPACDEEAAAKLGATLTQFFIDMDGGAPEEEAAAPEPTPPPREPSPPPAPVRATAPAPPPRQTRASYSSPPARQPARQPARSSYSSSSGGSSTSWMQPKEAIAGDARSSASRRQDEMKDMFGTGGGGSVKDRMKAFNNNNKVNFDPVHFAVNLNKSEKARRDAQRAAKESAKRFQVNSTIATKTAEDFKQMGEDRKAAKKESIETAKMNSSAGLVISIHDTAPGFKKMLEERKEKKKESIQTAMMYNYKYGDGSVVDESSANFKKMGEDRKMAKKESVETAMRYNYNYGDGGIVDETVSEFKAMGDGFKAAQKESKDTAMMYNYNYGDGGVVDETVAEFKDMGEATKAAARESKETAMMYNYNYGDGGVVEEEVGRFKDHSDQSKAAKAQAEEINMGFNYVYQSND